MKTNLHSTILKWPCIAGLFFLIFIIHTSAAAINNRGNGAVVFFNASYFSARHVVDIEWQTLHELNYQVQYYKVEKSTDGSNINTGAIITAVGTSDELHNYSTQCDSLESGWNYFRITTVDINGEIQSTEWKAVYVENNNIHLYPTLLTPNEGIMVGGVDEYCELQIYGMKGRMANEYSLQPGSNSICVKGLSEGIYYCFVISGGQVLKTIKIEVVTSL